MIAPFQRVHYSDAKHAALDDISNYSPSGDRWVGGIRDVFKTNNIQNPNLIYFLYDIEMKVNNISINIFF